MRTLLVQLLICGSLAVAMTSRAQPAPPADLDRNGDGLVTRAEWRAAQQETRAEAMPEPDRGRDLRVAVFGDPGHEPFWRLDLNGDGRVTGGEWRWSRASFDERDLNGDGVLSQAEVEAGLHESVGTSYAPSCRQGGCAPCVESSRSP
jgi:hypothetical protein